MPKSERAGRSRSRDLSEVHAGDVLVVRPGGHIPVDGTVVTGHSFVDQASITGESLPVEKGPGTKVFAGTINHSGVLEIEAEKVGRDTAFGRIIEAVERAENSRAPIQRLADRLAGYLVYFALGCAALTFLITRDARSTISVIVVAGACGIAAGTPLAILGAIGRAARYGAIIKGGLYLELLGSVDTVVLDKTGTLTSGAPEILDVLAFNGSSCAGCGPHCRHRRALFRTPSRQGHYQKSRGIVAYRRKSRRIFAISLARASSARWMEFIPRSEPTFLWRLRV